MNRASAFAMAVAATPLIASAKSGEDAVDPKPLPPKAAR
jgi:hypothetical protein